jgi:hypothetical protein
MAHAKTLQDKLAQSLDKANATEAAAVKKTEAALDKVRRDYLAKVKPLQDKLGKAPAAAAPLQGGGCTKLSVSLFAGDLARLDAIRDYMAARGVRLSTSQAVKVALRTAPLSEALAEALDAIRAEDGRKW